VKALSIKQPWASFIAQGQKTIETRTWPTKYRGPLLVCSSARPDIYPGPAGFALAVVTLVDCRPMVVKDSKAALDEYSPGRWSWVLADVRRIELFPVKGRLGLFEIPFEDLR
jgi:hypothetical protein